MTNKVIKNMLVKEVKFFKQAGLMLLRFARKIPNVGASYHVGNLQDRWGSPVLNSSGKVPNISNVYVIDSSSLPRIPVGPITLAAVINARRIVHTSLMDRFSV